MAISPTSKESVSGTKAFENYLNDVPIPDPTSQSTGKMPPHASQLQNLNFQLGGDGKMANDGH